ncbi:hypothetical protein [Nitrosospira multiformis]|uniref:hypothetical protein n=1 Tax=Nitrosospira multiformis TaxID=1231 RepID=UPI00142ED060|nr:hypothetical protein [Nitrosospira multiformis]
MNIRFLYRSINFPESRRQRLGASAEGGAVPSEGSCDPERAENRTSEDRSRGAR